MIDCVESMACDFLHQLGNIVQFCDTTEEHDSLEELSSDSQIIFKLASRRAIKSVNLLTALDHSSLHIEVARVIVICGGREQKDQPGVLVGF